MNNQFNDYNNFNNQNGMYPQNNMYNGYQQPMNMNNMQNNRPANRGGGAGSVIFALLLLAVLVVALLHLTGTVDVVAFVNEKVFGKEQTKEVDKSQENNDKPEDKDDKEEETSIDYKAELEKTCTLIDTDGNYNMDVVTKKLNEALTNDSTLLEKNPKAVFELMSGIYYCSEKTCIYVEPDSLLTHAVNCETKEYESGTIDEMQAGIELGNACANVDSNGYFVGENNVNCSNFMCTYNVNGQKYERNCLDSIMALR